MSTSWKTTVCGILAAVGAILMGMGDERYKQIGTACIAIGLALGGINQRDHDVGDTAAGVPVPPVEVQATTSALGGREQK